MASPYTCNTAGRANILAQRIRAGKTNGRAFDTCLEMGDGDEVVRRILVKAQTDPRILAFAERCGWTAPGYLDG